MEHPIRKLAVLEIMRNSLKHGKKGVMNMMRKLLLEITMKNYLILIIAEDTC